MAVYCRKCGQERDYPFSAMRTSRAPCDYCGGYDEYDGFNRRTRKPQRMRQNNYSYPDNLLPGPNDVNTTAEREYESAP